MAEAKKVDNLGKEGSSDTDTGGELAASSVLDVQNEAPGVHQTDLLLRNLAAKQRQQKLPKVLSLNRTLPHSRAPRKTTHDQVSNELFRFRAQRAMRCGVFSNKGGVPISKQLLGQPDVEA